MKNTTIPAGSVVEFITPAELNALHSDLLAKAKEYFSLDNSKVTAAQAMAAKESMEKATSKYNDAVKMSAYDTALASEHPIGYLCKARKYTTMHARNSEKTGVSTTARSARFDLFDFIEYAASEDINKPVVGADMLKEKLKTVAEKLKVYVDACIRKEAAPVTKHCAAALQDLFVYIGVPGVSGRGKDVRFLSFAVTRAKELGELAEITADSIVPFILDVYHVQLLGKEYSFEGKKSENK